MWRAVVAVFVMGCGSPHAIGERPTSPAAMQDQPIHLELRAHPRALTMATRSKFLVGFVITNTGSKVIDPEIDGCELLVDGTPSMDFGFAVSNGARESTWYALPPTEHVEREWPLGEDLFQAPGDYALVLRLGEQQTPAVHVTVR